MDLWVFNEMVLLILFIEGILELNCFRKSCDIFTTKICTFNELEREALWKHCGKRRKCLLPEFLLFPQYFLLTPKQSSIFLSHIFCHLQRHSNWTGVKFRHLLVNFNKKTIHVFFSNEEIWLVYSWRCRSRPDCMQCDIWWTLLWWDIRNKSNLDIQTMLDLKLNPLPNNPMFSWLVWCLMPFSTVFQLHCGNQLHCGIQLHWDNFRFDENGRLFSKLVENTVGKGEIACYKQFLLFTQCFRKTCTTDT